MIGNLPISKSNSDSATTMLTAFSLPCYKLRELSALPSVTKLKILFYYRGRSFNAVILSINTLFGLLRKLGEKGGGRFK